MPPRHVGKRPACTKSRHFQTQNRKIFWGEGNPSSPDSSYNVVSNTLVLPPRAIRIHTTASFPTSNGFWRLKRFKQSMEKWTMNCKNSAQNALNVAIFRLKIEKFSMPLHRPLPHWEGGYSSPKNHPRGASILAPAALGHSAPRSSCLRRSTLPLDPPFANPGSATEHKQGVALTGRNTNGPTRAAPSELRCICDALQTTDDRRRQTPPTVTSLALLDYV